MIEIDDKYFKLPTTISATINSTVCMSEKLYLPQKLSRGWYLER